MLKKARVTRANTVGLVIWPSAALLLSLRFITTEVGEDMCGMIIIAGRK